MFDELYWNSQASVSERVADLLARMTLAEKIAQLHAAWLLLAANGEHQHRWSRELATSFSHGLGQITRPLGSGCVNPEDGVAALNRLQQELRENTRLGIPAWSHEEGLVGLMCKGATLFPSALCYAASWNPDLLQQVATAIRNEAKSIGCQQILAPVLDVTRDLRWGRIEETFGEDPYLVGLLACAFVRGIQGESRDMLATLKHYVGHSYSEGGRNHAPVHLGWRELNDTFMLPFEMAVKLAKAGSIMPAYHDLDNVPAHADHYLLTTVLREQWGFDGLVVADYGGINLLHEDHHVSSNARESAALAFNAGVDVELPENDCASHLESALAAQLITQEHIDQIVSRILRFKFELGLFENPYADVTKIALQTPESIALAREMACQGIVVLENNGILPLSPHSQRKIALIGPTANDPLALLSGYSFPVHLIMSEVNFKVEQVVTPLAALRKIYGSENISYAQGCYIIEERGVAPVYPAEFKRVSAVPLSVERSLIAPAVELAQASDLAIVCLGDLAGLGNTGTIGEGSDCASLQLPALQQELLEAILATQIPTILVMTGARPYDLNGLESSLAGYLQAFAPGQEGGTAIAAIISGQCAPSGRLPLSVSRSVGAMPYSYNHKFKSAGSPPAFHFAPRYHFGYGLSWSKFSYANLELSQTEFAVQDGVIEFHLEVSNSGNCGAFEVVQVYIRDICASLVRPLLELKAFQKLWLEAGQLVLLKFSIPSDMLNFTNLAGKRMVEAGEFDLMVGASANDIRQSARFKLSGENMLLTEFWRMESSCELELRAKM